ncbi:MAG TPA: FkbM family methyltransferase [Thermoanaerobacter sp.]|nr:FkbM family methyltransferase [Thermoanaerobacter sp.]
MEVTCRYGIFEVMFPEDLISKSLIEYGEWAQLEIETLAKFIKPGDTVIDAGAYIGTHTMAFAKMVGNGGRVLAFEPNPNAFEILKKNCMKNCENVELYQYALGDKEGEVSLCINMHNSNVGSSYIVNSSVSTTNNGFQIIVEQRRLDSIVDEPVHFIKADVEGMEFKLLKGSENLINNYKPVIFTEINSLENAVVILGWAKKFNYLVYGVITSAYNERNYNLSTNNIFGEAKECGLLLIHLDKFLDHEDSLYVLNLPKIETVDDLALLLLHKPQYPYEILSNSKAALKLGIDYSAPKVKSLENTLLAKEKEIDKLKEEIDIKEFSINELASKIKALEAILETKEKEVEELRKEIVSKESTINELASSIKALKATIEVKEREIGELKVEIVNKEAIISELDSRAKFLESELEKVRKVEEECKSKEEFLNIKNFQLQKRIEEVQSELEIFKKQAQDLENEIIGYIFSTSWKITRPLRKTKRLIKRILGYLLKSYQRGGN